MENAERPLAVGSSVAVRMDVADPDLGYDISGWQGWVVEIVDDEPYGRLICVEWDSVTLRNMPVSFIREADVEGVDWTRTYLLPEALRMVTPRDEPSDSAPVAAELSDKYESILGEQGERIRHVLAEVQENDELQKMSAWADYLLPRLDFPFDAEVTDFQERGPLQEDDIVAVSGIDMVDEEHGIIVDVKHEGRNYDFPLCELRVLDEESVNYILVDDYCTWFNMLREEPGRPDVP